jgi:hypothetical protein
LLESGSEFASKSGKINKPSSVSIDGKTPCFCQICLKQTAISRVSLEKSTSP